MSIDTTPAGVDSDSYIDVAAADALAAADLGPESDRWTAGNDDEKEAALRRATREIDGYLGTGWPAFDAATPQALLFPRSIDADDDGEPLIPRAIERACYQQAIYVLKNAAVLAAANVHRARADGSDPGQAYAVDPYAGPAIISPMALHYLSGFRVAPKPGKAGGLRSLRVSVGFPGGY